MIARTISIPYKIGDKFKILPIGDIHYDGQKSSSTCDSKKLKKFLAANVDSRTMIIGMGDWFGGILTKDMKRYSKGTDGANSPAILDESIEGLYEIFKPYRKNVIALTDGNHEETILNYSGTNLIERFSKMLNSKTLYMGYSWLLKLAFKENGARVRPLIIRGHHGWGNGGNSEGGDITKFTHDVKFWQAQLFLYGHVHKIKVNPMEEGIMVGDKQWRTIQKTMVVCGTFQKTYTNTTVATYAEKRGYHPASTTTPIITAIPTYSNGVRVEVTV